MRARSILAALTVALALAGCGTGDEDTGGSAVYQNQIFTRTDVIAAGQSGSLSQPDFSWPAVGEKHVVCAIFAAHISVSDDLITNPQDVRWIWHSGLGAGRDGNVYFTDGVASADTQAPPTPLPSGTYYWAVWAFDDGGHPNASSIEYQLAVP